MKKRYESIAVGTGSGYTQAPVPVTNFEMSGFVTRSHFNTLFRERFKMTPSEYRKATKE